MDELFYPNYKCVAVLQIFFLEKLAYYHTKKFDIRLFHEE